MTANKLNIGVIGVGYLGRLHVQQLNTIPVANVVGIYDIDSKRAKAVGKEFSVKPFASVERLLEKSDALSIVTPTRTHFEYALQAIRKGKHVFIEKPMTSTVEEAEQLVQEARQRGVKIQVGHIERFNGAVLALEPLEINPLFIESHRLANFNPRGTDVAVVLDLMIHDIDLILSFVKSPVKEIHASGVQVISDTPDIANCRLMFENGCVANVTASRISARKMRKMRFFEPEAYISVDFLEGFSEVYYLAGETINLQEAGFAFSLGEIEKSAHKREIRYARLERRDVNPLQYELEQFCRAVLEDRTPAVTGEDGLRALRIANAIMQKIDEHTAYVQTHWQGKSARFRPDSPT